MRWCTRAFLALWWMIPVPLAAANLLEVYVAEGCPHCAAAKDYLDRLAPRLGDLEIRYFDTAADAEALAALQQWSRAAGIWPPGVPTFVRDGAVQVGFADDSQGRRELERFILEGARAAGEVEIAWLGRLSAERLGLPLFTLVLGLLDGFNPCAMWVLLFLLALLVRLRDRGRMALIAGTFVAVSGVIYYAFRLLSIRD
jgi:glutaredoxin